MDNKKARKLKVLVLHGYNNYASIIEFQSKYFRSLIEDLIEFEYLNAPYIVYYDKPVP